MKILNRITNLRNLLKPLLDLFAVSGSAFNYVHKCLKCEFEGNIANSMED